MFCTVVAPILRSLLFALAMLSLGEAATAQAADQPARILRVFLLSGQSNMQGQGVVDLDHPRDYNGGKGTLLWALEHAESKDRMQHLRTGDEWAVRDDVFVRYQTERELKKGPLTIGFAGYPGRHHMGLELQFGHVVGEHFTEPVLLIKTCWGGKSLFQDFRPPSAEGDTGPYYTQMIRETRAALSSIAIDFPQLADCKPELTGFVWMQGWNDMINDQSREEYADNLVHLIHDIRAEFNAPELPVVIGELGNGGPAKPDSGMQQFRDAQ
ncbi:MAG: hypothetical protein KDA58_07545, partial [Planctomycetaceae bacterium]|nr:hypothetical protein [Planctomycetaceae bacterium]